MKINIVTYFLVSFFISVFECGHSPDKPWQIIWIRRVRLLELEEKTSSQLECVCVKIRGKIKNQGYIYDGLLHDEKDTKYFRRLL